jgi:DNA-binding MarR family transcriptional regulator
VSDLSNREENLARKLLEMFQSFPKHHRYQCPIPNLRPSELMMLFHIRQEVLKSESGLKVSEISKNLMVSSPTVTQIVNNLVKQGLAERSIDIKDRRAVRIRVTETGERTINSVEKEFLNNSIGLVKYLGEDKTTSLIEIMSQVCTYFSEGIYNDFDHE